MSGKLADFELILPRQLPQLKLEAGAGHASEGPGYGCTSIVDEPDCDGQCGYCPVNLCCPCMTGLRALEPTRRKQAQGRQAV